MKLIKILLIFVLILFVSDVVSSCGVGTNGAEGLEKFDSQEDDISGELKSYSSGDEKGGDKGASSRSVFAREPTKIPRADKTPPGKLGDEEGSVTSSTTPQDTRRSLSKGSVGSAAPGVTVDGVDYFYGETRINPTNGVYSYSHNEELWTFRVISLDEGDVVISEDSDVLGIYTDSSGNFYVPPNLGGGNEFSSVSLENKGYGDYYVIDGDPSNIFVVQSSTNTGSGEVTTEMVTLVNRAEEDDNPIYSDNLGNPTIVVRDGKKFVEKNGVMVTEDNQFVISGDVDSADADITFIGFDLATFLDTGATDLINRWNPDGYALGIFKRWDTMDKGWAQRMSDGNQWFVESHCKRAMDQNSPVSGVIGPNGDFVLSINAESVETFWVNNTNYSQDITSELYKIEFEIFPSEEIFKPGYLTFNIRVCEGTNCDTIDLTPLNDSNGIDLVIEVGRSEPYSKKGYNMILRTSEDEPFFSNQDKEYDRVCFEFKGDLEKDIIGNTYYRDGSRSSFLDDNLRYCNTLVSTEDLSGDTAGHGPGDWIPSWADGGSGSSSGGSGGSEGEENLP